MFNNIGQKIKAAAKFLCWVGIISSIVVGFTWMMLPWTVGTNNLVRETVCGILVMAIGPLVSWLWSIILYGFGQLIENTTPSH